MPFNVGSAAILGSQIDMTISREDHDQNLSEAFAIMLEQLGDEYTDSQRGVFDPSGPRFAGIHRSTWAEMEHLGLVRRDLQISGRRDPDYLLTPKGWYMGHHRLGHTQKGNEFIAKLARISKALKDCIKQGNREEVNEHAQTVAESARVSYGFFCNVIDSGALEKRFGQRGARWRGHAGWIICIPANFGLKGESVFDE